MSINTITISGRLGAKPELKTTTSQKTVAKFSVAVDEGYGDKKKSNWVTVECWDRNAEAVGKFGDKGLRIAVTGRLSFDEWTDKNENKVVRAKVVASSLEFIDFPAKEEEGF
jgi:single-strand DNA-binding protein